MDNLFLMRDVIDLSIRNNLDVVFYLLTKRKLLTG